MSVKKKPRSAQEAPSKCPSDAQSRGLATIPELQKLHGLLLVHLVDGLTAERRAGVEQLAVARSFLADNGFAGHWQMPRRTRQKLQRLYGALCQQFADSMQQERPSPRLMSELRMFLNQQHVGKDFTAAMDGNNAGGIAQILAGLDLPFLVP